MSTTEDLAAMAEHLRRYITNAFPNVQQCAKILAMVDALAATREPTIPEQVINLVRVLERTAANTDTDPRWRAAQALRKCVPDYWGGWDAAIAEENKGKSHE
jgi:hypothetical protein